MLSALIKKKIISGSMKLGVSSKLKLVYLEVKAANKGKGW